MQLYAYKHLVWALDTLRCVHVRQLLRSIVHEGSLIILHLARRLAVLFADEVALRMAAQSILTSLNALGSAAYAFLRRHKSTQKYSNNRRCNH